MSEASSPSPAPAEHEALDLVRGLSLGKFFSQQSGRGKTPLVRAVHDATIGIAAGQTVGLVGESGSGKTTLGRLLLRLLEPSFGRVMFDGREITHYAERDLRPLRREMQLLFQDAPASLDDWLSVGEIVAEPLRIHGLVPSREDEQQRVSELLAAVGLPASTSSRRPAELSSGQCQRVSLARALALEPRFIVCDEPVAALDAREQATTLELLRSLQHVKRHAYLFISHDLRVVLHSSERVYVMYAGRIVESADADTLRRNAGHPYTRALLNAIPEVDPRRRRLRLVLEGEPPSPFQPIEGCAFYPRCPRAKPGLCEREAPPLAAAELGKHHDVACWYPYV
jgi:oligopeptide/dipeptide ABC transporter ATP-binding protein